MTKRQASQAKVRVLEGDCRVVLAMLPSELVQCCVTSPPYWGLRDYGHGDQLGLEKTPEEYVEKMVAVFREVRRVLRKDGMLWLNIGDSYARGFGGGTPGEKSATNAGSYSDRESRPLPNGLKGKDLVGVPWMLAFALRADGWFLRSDIIWSKPNPMPESVTDRPTKAHEYLFLLTKSASYYYDANAIAEPVSPATVEWAQTRVTVAQTYQDAARGDSAGFRDRIRQTTAESTRNRRTVWTIATSPFPGAHFAVMPPKLVEPCILAGTKRDDMVLDPFAGAGTVGLVASRLGRSFVGIELNPEYAKMARQRIRDDAPLFAGDAA